MLLKAEIAELCKAIHQFETHMVGPKEELFNMPIITKELVWNHVVGESHKSANSNQLIAFFQKHGLKMSQQDIQLVLWQYSSNKDDRLNPADLWQIFCPLTIKLTNQVMKVRAKKMSIARFHEASYKISDILCVIMSKTIDFLKSADEMKRNIVAASPEQMSISPLDAAHLQIYINNHAPDLLLKDVQIVFKHIMRNQQHCQKTFQQYFIPSNYRSGKFNPNFVREDELAQEATGIELIKYHMENAYFIRKEKFKKPLYLHDHNQRRY